jgi:hypothetical protein
MKSYAVITTIHRLMRILLALLAFFALTAHGQNKPDEVKQRIRIRAQASARMTTLLLARSKATDL